MKKILITAGVLLLLLLAWFALPWIKIFFIIERDSNLFVDVDQTELNRNTNQITERDKESIDLEINRKISVLRMDAEEYFSRNQNYESFCEDIVEPKLGSIMQNFGSDLNCRDSQNNWIVYAHFLSETFQSPAKYSCVDSTGKWVKPSLEPTGFVCDF
jgi:hypothetical protein